jgi:hypothetical protein
MNYYYVFYGISVADGVKNVFDTFSNIFTLLTVISLIAFVVVVGVTTNEKLGTEDKASALNWRKFIGRTFWFSITVCIITWLGYVATPSKKDCLLIVAGGAVGNFITSDTSAKAIPSDITSFLHLSLKEEMKAIGSDVKDEVVSNVKKQLDIQTPQDKFVEKLKTMSKEEIIHYLQDTTITK